MEDSGRFGRVVEDERGFWRAGEGWGGLRRAPLVSQLDTYLSLVSHITVAHPPTLCTRVSHHPPAPPELANLAANESASESGARFTRLGGRDQNFEGWQKNAYSAVLALQLSFHFAWHSSISAAPQILVFDNFAEFRGLGGGGVCSWKRLRHCERPATPPYGKTKPTNSIRPTAPRSHKAGHARREAEICATDKRGATMPPQPPLGMMPLSLTCPDLSTSPYAVEACAATS